MVQGLVVFVVALLVASSTAIPDKSKWERLTCQKHGGFTPNEVITAKVDACGRGDCVYQCQARAFGLLNDDGSTSLEIYNEWVDATFPEDHKEFAKKFFGDCYNKFGQYIDLVDTTCQMSKQFGDCTWGILPYLKCAPQ